MNSKFKFPEIDTSYWQTKDKDWVLERKAQWEVIAPMLVQPKSGKGITAIKQYFLKGKMPDWDRFRDWNNDERHVDLFMFLWLHPSWDEEVLTELRNAYVSSDVIVYDDVRRGFGIFLSMGTVDASVDYSERVEEVPSWLHTDGHNELLFKVLMGNLESKELKLEFLDRGLGREKKIFRLPECKFSELSLASRWLLIDKMFPINNDMLLQYDLPLEWWYQSVKGLDYFRLNKKNARSKSQYFKALYRIHHFDTEKEGDTCRTRFVHKIRKILDERDFIPEFKQMWEDVKAGNVEVKDPWAR